LPRRLNLISFHLHEKRKPIINNSYKLLVRLIVTKTYISLSQTVFNLQRCEARPKKNSISTVVTTEFKHTYLYSNKLHSSQRDLASFKIIFISAIHYDARALTSHLSNVTQMMYGILSTNPIKGHSYFRQIQITITTTNCKVFLTKLLESYSMFLIILLFLVYLSRLSISLIIPASDYRMINEKRIKRHMYGSGRGIVKGTFQFDFH
jgi:hypothetical protein